MLNSWSTKVGLLLAMAIAPVAWSAELGTVTGIVHDDLRQRIDRLLQDSSRR